MPDNHYENIKLAQLYDMGSPWNNEREFYFSLPNSNTKSILDIGSGTGLIARALTKKGYLVTAIDPSLSMLKVGKNSPFGDKVTWIRSSAQSFKLNQSFDLIIMTGNAFQVLLKNKDILEALTNMKKHLNPKGRIAFETRNPMVDWQKNWDTDNIQETNNKNVHISRRFLSLENNIMSFVHTYKFSHKILTSESKIRFSSHIEIKKLIHQSNLCIDKLYGDWDKEEFNQTENHKEMVFILKHQK